MKFTAQHDIMDCGPTCLLMVAKHYGKNFTLRFLREKCFITREGVSLAGISEAAKAIGFRSVSAKTSVETLSSVPLPCIIHWNQNHFVVLYEIRSRKGKNIKYKIADPGHGKISLAEDNFKRSWLTSDDEGIVLILEPTTTFYQLSGEKEKGISVKYLLSYLKPFKQQIVILSLLLLLGSLITLVVPFITQNLIDKGIHAKDLPLIKLLLMAQLALFLGTISIGIIRNWLMLYIGTKINITIISEYLSKILKLPVKFFETKVSGDFKQRIQDHERIENFLASQSLLTFFSLITLSVFLWVLYHYNSKLLSLYLLLTLIAVGWSLIFFKKRKNLDYYRFQKKSENQEAIHEILNGVTEMKLNRFETFKKSRWESIQHELHSINLKLLRLDQFQLSGYDLINQIKNVVVTFLSSIFVVKGDMTLGQLLSVSFIIGQMNSPLGQLINFFRSYQDAKISMERLSEVQEHEEEEQPDDVKFEKTSSNRMPGIEVVNLSFRYGGSQSPQILKNINLFIPEGKITAIIGASGSGKSTLMKLLLKFYEPTEGYIYFNDQDINNISAGNLRENCGVVMQDGYLFAETIERNIIMADEKMDENRYEEAIEIANIKKFIQSLPLQEKTKVGSSGIGLSGGQKQRLLIARAVYKNPKFIFLDEATSALDTGNEKTIHDNLLKFFREKTVIIIAHRLSTVKNADQILVLKDGELVEKGSHRQLILKKNEYYNLVKNQLELGS